MAIETLSETKAISKSAQSTKALMPIEQVIGILAQHLLRAPVSDREVAKVVFECLVKNPENTAVLAHLLPVAFKPTPGKKPSLSLVKRIA